VNNLGLFEGNLFFFTYFYMYLHHSGNVSEHSNPSLQILTLLNLTNITATYLTAPCFVAVLKICFVQNLYVVWSVPYAKLQASVVDLLSPRNRKVIVEFAEQPCCSFIFHKELPAKKLHDCRGPYY
jgi:hypothetical protein